MKLFAGMLILVGAIYLWMFISAVRRKPDEIPFWEMDP